MSFFVVFLSFALFVTSALEDHTEVKVRSGQNVTLHCQGPRGLNITMLEWSKPEFNSESYVFFFQNHRLYENYQHESVKGRVALKDRSMKDGDVSVILRNVNINDTGTYSCEITTRTNGRVVHEVVHSINLKVTDSDENIKGGEEEDGKNMNKTLLVLFGVSVTFAVMICVVILIIVIPRRTQKENSHINYTSVNLQTNFCQLMSKLCSVST
ncbi:unnamed protein product [Oreochromis niloticus]|nr:unnamed protein product [Mustela putorius furo]